MTTTATRLLIAVVNDPEKIDEILSGFLEMGVTGATVIGSEGMGRLLSHDIPIFAGLQTLIAGSRPQNRTIFSVVPQDRLDDALAVLQEVCGNLASPATGIAVVVPVDRVVGLAPELGGEGSPI
jgi:nitrogen regulatory protein P-II 1